MCFVNLYMMFLPVHSSFISHCFSTMFAFAKRSDFYIWTILSREAIVQLGNNFFPSSCLVETFGVVKFIVGL